MLLYRLTKCVYANDLSGAGARLYGGRWNSEGKPAVYFASSRSLAVLEALVHLSPTNFPDDYCMVTLEAPNNFVAVPENVLPKNWQDHHDVEFLKQLGNKFLIEKKTLLFKVPSAIVREEYNYLLNPLHAVVTKLKVNDVQPYKFDNRLIGE